MIRARYFLVINSFSCDRSKIELLCFDMDNITQEPVQNVGGNVVNSKPHFIKKSFDVKVSMMILLIIAVLFSLFYMYVQNSADEVERLSEMQSAAIAYSVKSVDALADSEYYNEDLGFSLELSPALLPYKTSEGEGTVYFSAGGYENLFSISLMTSEAWEELFNDIYDDSELITEGGGYVYALDIGYGLSEETIDEIYSTMETFSVIEE